MKFKAYAWSVLGTAVPIGAALLLSKDPENDHYPLVWSLVVGGAFLGPSLGQFYANAPGQGALGFGIRGLGGFLALAGMAERLSGLGCGMDFSGDSEKCPEPKDGTPLILAGTFIYLGGTLYSLFDTGWAVDRLRNRPSDSQFGWAPTLDLGTSGSTRTGLSAWMRF